MRVALNAWFWDSPTTGSGQYTRCLVERLAKIAPDLEIALVAPEKALSSLKSQTPNVWHQPIANRYRLPANLYKVWFEQVAFPRACRRLGADVAHVPYWAPLLRPSVPTVVTIHDLIPLLLPEYRGGPLVRLYTALVSSAAQSASLVLTDSEASRRDIVAHLGLPEARVRVIYLAAGERYAPLQLPPKRGESASRRHDREEAPSPVEKNVSRWHDREETPSPAGERARESDIAQYELPERYVLYLGGFDVRKNVTVVIAAYGRAAPTIGESCPLVIAGRLPAQDTPFTPDPRRLAREQGLDERCVRFIGLVDEKDKPALYRSAVALVFPSRYEGFGLMVLEAMACGTPVVGSNASSIPEVVGDGGVLLPPDDVAGMATALIRLATDEEFRADLSRRALAQAAKFSWERTARETLAAYQESTADCRSQAKQV
jgi:glycosyltransferase involved in cell wall biosynthesis